MTDIKKIIQAKGGIFVEELIIAKRKYTKIICENKHESIKRNDAFKKTWCQQCTNNTIDIAHNLAKEKGFKFLSTEYKNSSSHYLWECKEGHTWTAKYYNIHSGKGCPECLKVPYEFFVDLITNKEGKIITTKEEYFNIKTRIEFECKYGHKCKTTGCILRSESWCRECQTSLCERTCRKIFEYLFNLPFLADRHLKNPETNKGIELDGYNKDLKLAFEYNGKQHYEKIGYWQTDESFSKQQERDTTKERLCIEEGINLIIIPYTVKYEDLYNFIVNKFPDNNFDKIIDYSVLNLDSYGQDRLDQLKLMIKPYDGIIVSKSYITNTTPMDFICKKGHEFQNTYNNIQQGFFCKKGNCNKATKSTLPKIEEFCKNNNFKLVSEYTRAKDVLTWQCTKCDVNIERAWDRIRTTKGHFKCINA
jgi:hypothetical protein